MSSTTVTTTFVFPHVAWFSFFGVCATYTTPIDIIATNLNIMAFKLNPNAKPFVPNHKLNSCAKSFIPQSFKNCIPSFLLDDNIDPYF